MRRRWHQAQRKADTKEQQTHAAHVSAAMGIGWWWWWLRWWWYHRAGRKWLAAGSRALGPLEAHAGARAHSPTGATTYFSQNDPHDAVIILRGGRGGLWQKYSFGAALRLDFKPLLVLRQAGAEAHCPSPHRSSLCVFQSGFRYSSDPPDAAACDDAAPLNAALEDKCRTLEGPLYGAFF